MYRPKLLILFVLLLIVSSSLLIYLLYPRTRLRTTERLSDSTLIDTLSQDTVKVEIIDGEEVVKSFFIAYCNNYNGLYNDSKDRQLFYDYMTHDYATKFVKNAPMNFGGEAHYCDMCGEYESSDYLHFCYPHSIPGMPERIWFKSITKDSVGRYIVAINTEWWTTETEIDVRRFRVSVTNEDGENKICCIEDFESNPAYDYAIIRTYRNEYAEYGDTI